MHKKQNGFGKGLANVTKLLWGVAIIITATGCGYRPGKAPAGFDSTIRAIAIPIFENVSREPLIETSLTEAVREEFIDDGRLKVVSEDVADLILRGRITGYTTRTLAFDASDRASEVRAMIDVRASLVERRGGKELISFDLQARSEYRVSETLSELEKARKGAELRAFKELAEKLSELVYSGL